MGGQRRLRLMYSIWSTGRHGDLMIRDRFLVEDIVHKKYPCRRMVLLPRDLAFMMAATIEEHCNYDRHCVKLRLYSYFKEGGMKLVDIKGGTCIFRVDPGVPFNERIRREENYVVRDEDGWKAKYLHKRKCSTLFYIDGRRDEKCDEEERLVERWRDYRHRDGVVRVVQEASGETYVELHPERWDSIGDCDVLFMVSSWIRRVRSAGYSPEVARSAAKLMLARKGFIWVANSKVLPPYRYPTRDLIDYARSIARQYGLGEDSIRYTTEWDVEVGYDMYMPIDEVEKWAGKRLTPCQRRLVELLFLGEEGEG